MQQPIIEENDVTLADKYSKSSLPLNLTIFYPQFFKFDVSLFVKFHVIYLIYLLRHSRPVGKLLFYYLLYTSLVGRKTLSTSETYQN